jgi:hypothetical protein
MSGMLLQPDPFARLRSGSRGRYPREWRPRHARTAYHPMNVRGSVRAWSCGS